MIAVLIYILWVLVALAVIVLMAPIHFDLEGKLAESLTLKGRVRWGGGILNFNVNFRQGKALWSWGIFGFKKQISFRPGKEARKTKNDETGNHEDVKKRRKKSTTCLTSFLNLDFFRVVKEAFHKLLWVLHLKLNLSGVYGFDDPSLTGIVLGWICALKIRNSSIHINPDFTREVIDLEGRFKGWFVPLQIIVTVIGILLMKPVRAIWWPRIKFGKKQKEAVKYA